MISWILSLHYCSRTQRACILSPAWPPSPPCQQSLQSSPSTAVFLCSVLICSSDWVLPRGGVEWTPLVWFPTQTLPPAEVISIKPSALSSPCSSGMAAPQQSCSYTTAPSLPLLQSEIYKHLKKASLAFQHADRGMKRNPGVKYCICAYYLGLSASVLSECVSESD